MTTNGLESAFGFSETRYNEQGQAFSSLTRRGLTKREYFAALAMQGLANESSWVPIEIAQMSVQLADELIAALNAEGQAND